MTKPRIHRRVVRNRKKNAIPLSKLRTSDAVRTVVDHPRRLQELLRMLEDKDRSVRGRAAAALARLAESHPARLQRVILQIREGLLDESAYVRWHLVYAFGKIGASFPAPFREFLNDLVLRLDDENRVVACVAGKALSQVAARKPLIIEEFFQTLKREIPPSIARVLRSAKNHAAK
jgi:HEAT repeat protein